jgi:peptidoglycan hydrolase CwlO-like protein
METFYIFGFGVLFTLVVAAVIYSVFVISNLKKKNDEVLGEFEDLQGEVSSLEGTLEAELQKIKNRIDTEVNAANGNFNNIMNITENKINELEDTISKLRKTKN